MKKADIEIQALAALTRASEAATPSEKIEWLRVAQIWYEVQDGIRELGESPRPPDGFMAQLPRIENEEVRISIRVRSCGKVQVICDRKYEQPTGAEADSPSEAASIAMALLDGAEEL